MLISFTVENWMSFKEASSLSMVASRERQHGEQLSVLNKYKLKVLPIAVIYGGNASGKTNFFKALQFAKRFVTTGTKIDGLISVNPFKLDENMRTKPSKFMFEILIDEHIYAFEFSATSNMVQEEKLVKIFGSTEKILYHRKMGKIEFDSSLKKDQFANFIFKGTRDNQLFLTSAISQKMKLFRPVYDWFRETLTLISPDSQFEPIELFFTEGCNLYEQMRKNLPLLDTGVKRLACDTVPFESLGYPDEIMNAIKTELQESLKEGQEARFKGQSPHDRFTVSKKNGELKVQKLVTYHQTVNGTETKFDLREESDGTKRVLDLLPAFFEISDSAARKVYVIDEIDRSLHTHLTQNLIEAYLSSCDENNRSQLLLTTHDIMLMDQDLLRRDEIWVTEHDNYAASKLISFNDYKDIRYDKDIRKSYLQGRLGGIPRVRLTKFLRDSTSKKGCVE